MLIFRVKAKSEALFNIYSLLQEKIKSCNAKETVKTTRTVKTTIIGLISFGFSLPLIFTLVAASISHFLTVGIKFSCFSSNEIGLSCF